MPMSYIGPLIETPGRNHPHHSHTSQLQIIAIHLSLLLLGLLKHLLDDLLLLDQESTNDAVLDAVGAS